MRLLPFRRLLRAALVCGFAHAFTMTAATLPTNGTMLVYLGTYTGPKSQGIYVCRFNPATGQLAAPELAATTPSPSFLAVHPSRRFLYAVGETSQMEGKRTGTVGAFAIDGKSGQLTLLNHESSGGLGPCHLAVDKTGKCLLVANYGSGSIAALPIQANGALVEPATVIQHQGSSVNPQRQAGPHAHFITPTPDNRFALACDLGMDKILIYRLDPAKASLVASNPSFAAVQPGAGPRHLAFHPSGRFVFLVNEMGSTLTTFAYDAKRGALKDLHTVSTLPENFAGKNTCAGILVHPSGRFVYGSNRGDDSIAVFGFDPKSGRLTFVERQATQGRMPRHIAFDPTGQWLLAENQGSDNVVVFRADEQTGRLSATGQTITVGAPVCAVFVPLK